MLSIQDLVKLFPSIYDAAPGTNFYKILEVLTEGFADVMQDISDIESLRNIDTISGVSLTLWAADYGISRGDFTDEQLRILLNASLQNSVSGATIEKVLNFFGLLYTDYYVVELYRDELGHRLDGSRLLDGTHLLDGATSIARPLAFDVIVNDTIVNLPFIQNVLQNFLKAAGVKATINLLGAGYYGVGRYGAEYYGVGESGEYTI